MKRILLLILLSTLCTGCSYWPQTLKPDYYKEGAKEVKEDIDDVSGARTL